MKYRQSVYEDFGSFMAEAIQIAKDKISLYNVLITKPIWVERNSQGFDRFIEIVVFILRNLGWHAYVLIAGSLALGFVFFVGEIGGLLAINPALAAALVVLGGGGVYLLWKHRQFIEASERIGQSYKIDFDVILVQFSELADRVKPIEQLLQKCVESLCIEAFLDEATDTLTEYKPQPVLDVQVYRQILEVIHNVGKQFERLPGAYYDKSENDLRDHFLIALEARFGSATGETFNKMGKTDILLRYKGSNLFIAECKIWSGKKLFLEAISQLLGYLTSRDTKSALIFFVLKHEFSAIVKTVQEVISTHENYVKLVTVKDTTWFSYEFRHNEDTNQLIQVAVLLFHIPPLNKLKKDNSSDAISQQGTFLDDLS